MRDDASPPNLGQAKEEFDKRFFFDAFRSLELFFTKILSMGPIRVSTVTATEVNVSGGITAGGDIEANSLRLASQGDASLASTTHALQIGPTTGLNIIIDNNEMMARSNGAATTLTLNNDGGVVSVGVGGVSSRGSGITNIAAAGTLHSWQIAGVSVGAISVDGAGFVTYGAFCGTHWSQIADGTKMDILRGTIVESIAAMCFWPGEQPEQRLPRFKISMTVGSPAVYGVFHEWDEQWHATNDAVIASLGAYVIRMAPGSSVKIGDYVESAGTGCGRVQTNTMIRASTVAKITSTTVVQTYPDGSYLVPCTLHCG